VCLVSRGEIPRSTPSEYAGVLKVNAMGLTCWTFHFTHLALPARQLPLDHEA
jgi:hypothetical protein